MEHITIVPRYSEVILELPGSSNKPHQNSALVQRISESQPDHRSDTTAANPTTIVPIHHTPKDSSRSSQLSQWHMNWIVNWWGVEIACWIIAALSLGAIVLVLENYKNQPMPEWHFGITLNSYISIFATIGQMAMMKPVVECISQLKWLWFARRKKLIDFEALDDASRGPTGSLFLLWKLHGIHFVTLGAAITVVSAAFGPFAQQVVTYPLRLHPVGIAGVPQVFNITGSPFYNGQSSPETLAAMTEGLAPGNFNLSTITPTCSTGNCSWTGYSSLGVCASVSDLSSSIIYNACNLTAFEEIFDVAGFPNPGFPCFNYTLPRQGLTEINHITSQTVGLGFQKSNITLTNAFSDISLSQLPMKIMSIDPSFDPSSTLRTHYLMYQPGFSSSINSSLPDPVAYGLDLNLCIQTLNTTVSKGKTNTTIVSSQILETPFVQIYHPNNGTSKYLLNDSYVVIEGETFGISRLSLAILIQTTGSIFASCYDLPTNPYQPFFCDYTAGDSIFQGLLNSTDPGLTITEQWNNIAISMTNAFRTGAGGDAQVGIFEGTAFAPIIFVESNYLWLILPITLVVLTLVFLLTTISKSQRLGSRVWKSSNLATLQGLNSDLHTSLGGLSSLSEMEENAKEVEVRFNLDLNYRGKNGHDIEYRLVQSKQEASWIG